MKKIFLLSIFMVITCFTQEKNKLKEELKGISPVTLHTDSKKAVNDGEMKQYFLVLLKRGPMRNQDSVTSAAIQKGHLDNITRLFNEGKIDIAGPMMHDGDLRGIFVFNSDSYEEVQQLCSTDPAIKAEIYPWYAQKGSKLR
jgi:uncharacterized protein YciI